MAQMVRPKSQEAHEMKQHEGTITEEKSKVEYNKSDESNGDRPQDWAQMSPQIKDIYSNLTGIRNKLQHLKDSNEPHTMDDLRHYQQMLDAIDSRRKDGVFGGDLKKGIIPPGQAACYEVMDEAYDLLDHLVNTALPLQPEILSIQSELTGIARRLSRLKGQDYTFEDLRQYEQMLNAIDRARVDGIFCGSPKTQIPEGQARCSELLARCFECIVVYAFCELLADTELVEELKPSAQHMEQPLLEIHGHLLGLRDYLRDMKKALELFSPIDVYDVQRELDTIDDQKVDGVYGGTRHHIPAGQHVVRHIMATCRKLARQLLREYERREQTMRAESLMGYREMTESDQPNEWKKMPKSLKWVYRDLVNVRRKLQEMRTEEKPDSEDLFWLSSKLQNIKSKHDDAISGGSSMSLPTPTQEAMCCQMMEEATNLLESLFEKAEPMEDEAIKRIHSQLMGITRTLSQLKARGDYTFEELRHYEQMLNSVDSARVDGVFAGSPQTKVPKGQGRCSYLLAQAYDLVTEMKQTAHHMPPDVLQMFNRLESIRDNLREYKRGTMERDVSALDLLCIGDELDAIERDKLKPTPITASQVHVLQEIIQDCRKLVKQLERTTSSIMGEKGTESKETEKMLEELSTRNQMPYTHLLRIRDQLREYKTKGEGTYTRNDLLEVASQLHDIEGQIGKIQDEPSTTKPQNYTEDALGECRRTIQYLSSERLQQ